jgi:hypothetical protein
MFDGDDTFILNIGKKIAAMNPHDCEGIYSLISSLPRHIPHAFLAADSDGKPIVLVNPSFQEGYHPSSLSTSFPGLCVGVDNDINADMLLIPPTRMDCIFGPNSMVIPDTADFFDHHCKTNQDFSKIQKKGDKTTDMPKMTYLHPVVAAALLLYMSSTPSPSFMSLFEVIKEAATVTEDGKPVLMTHWIRVTLFFVWSILEQPPSLLTTPGLYRPRLVQEAIRDKLIVTFFGQQATPGGQGQVSFAPSASNAGLQGHLSIAADPTVGLALQKLVEVHEDAQALTLENIRSKSAFSNMPECKKTPLVRMGVSGSDKDYPTDPTENLRALFTKKNATDLYATINATLLKAGSSTGTLGLGHATEITTQGIIWKKETDPFGFTTFAFNPNNDDEATNTAISALVLKQQAENQQLDSSDLKILMNSKTFDPDNVADYMTQCNSLLATTIYIWKGKSFLANLIQYHINLAKKAERTYKTRQESDVLFLTKVGYSFNLLLQRFISDVAQHDDWDTFDQDYYFGELASLHNKVISSSAICKLPNGMMSTSTTGTPAKNNKRQNDNDKNKQGKEKKQKTKEEPFKCSFSKPEWKIPEKRSHEFSSIFTQQKLKKMPKAQGGKGNKTRAYCVRALATGTCKHGKDCQFNHGNPKDQNQTEAVDTFFKEAYEP